MQLLTKELLKRFEKVGRQEEATIRLSSLSFLIQPEPVHGTRQNTIPEAKEFFGYVSIFGDWNDEWGSFALPSLKATAESLD